MLLAYYLPEQMLDLIVPVFILKSTRDEQLPRSNLSLRRGFQNNNHLVLFEDLNRPSLAKGREDNDEIIRLYIGYYLYLYT